MDYPTSYHKANHMHILRLLINTITGTKQPASQSLLEHLAGCVRCQVLLGVCVLLYKKEESGKEQTQRTMEVFRAPLEEASHGMDFQNKLSMYIEILETQGEEGAGQQLPEIARHLKECEVCRAVVEDTLLLLHDMDEKEYVMSGDVEEMEQAEEKRELEAAPLPDEFLNALVAELDDEDVVGIILGGSYVRGEATPYSDVDIARFVADASKLRPKRFLYRDGRLVR